MLHRFFQTKLTIIQLIFLSIVLSCRAETVSYTSQVEMCRGNFSPRTKQIAAKFTQFRQQVRTLPVPVLKQQWAEKGVVRIPVQTEWLDQAIELVPKSKWKTHEIGITEELVLADSLPEELMVPLRDLKEQILQITGHQELGNVQNFVVRRWMDEATLRKHAQRVFGDENMAYPWHKDPRLGSAILTLRGRMGTQYIDPSENNLFEALTGSSMPLTFQIKEGAQPNIITSDVHDLVIIAGRHSANRGRQIIHRSPPNADPELGAGGRLILLLSLN